MKNMTVRFDEELWQKVKIECVKQDTSIQAIVIKLLEDWLKKAEAK